MNPDKIIKKIMIEVTNNISNSLPDFNKFNDTLEKTNFEAKDLTKNFAAFGPVFGNTIRWLGNLFSMLVGGKEVVSWFNTETEKANESLKEHGINVRELTLIEAGRKNELVELIKIANDETKSEAERLAAAQQASEIYQDMSDKRIKQLDDYINKQIEETAIAHGLTTDQIKDLALHYKENEKLIKQGDKWIEHSNELNGKGIFVHLFNFFSRDKEVNELTAKIRELFTNEEVEFGKFWEKSKKAVEEARGLIVGALTERKNIQAAANENAYKMEQASVQLSADLLVKAANEKKKLIESGIKAEEGYLSDDFNTRQEYAKKLLDLDINTEKEKLEILKSKGKISLEEYERQMTILENRSIEFHNRQAKERKDHQQKELEDLRKQQKEREEFQKKELESYKQQQQELLALIKTDTEKQIEEVEAGYRTMMEKLDDIKPPQKLDGQSQQDYENSEAYKNYLDLLMKKEDIELKLTADKEARIAEIKNNALDKQFQDMEQTLEKTYAGDLAKFTASELEKTALQITMQNDRIAQKRQILTNEYGEEKALLEQQLAENKISEEQYAQATADIEKAIEEKLAADINQLHLMELQQEQNIYNQKLANAEGNAAALYEIKREQLEKELELILDNEERKAEIQEEIDQLNRDREQQIQYEKEEAFNQWVANTTGKMNEVNNYISGIENNLLKTFTNTAEKEKAALKDKLNKKLISEKQYNSQIAEIEQDLDKKRTQIERQQAIRNKTLKLVEATINTASAIMKAAPIIPMMAAMGIAGAAQIAVIASQPIPKARRGMYIKGKKHEQGGVMIEAEDGEMIINSRSAQAYAPLLSAINQAGGGVPFVRPMSDGGYSSRTISQQGITAAEIETAMTNAVNNVQVYVAMNELREADQNYTKTMEQRSY